MPWGLNDPETTVFEEVHRTLERVELYPGTIKLLPLLRRADGVEVPPIPLHSLFGIVRYQMSRRAELCCLRTEKSACSWEFCVDRSAMIPVCVTYVQVSGVASECVLSVLPEEHRINVIYPDLSLC